MVEGTHETSLLRLLLLLLTLLRVLLLSSLLLLIILLLLLRLVLLLLLLLLLTRRSVLIPTWRRWSIQVLLLLSGIIPYRVRILGLCITVYEYPNQVSLILKRERRKRTHT